MIARCEPRGEWLRIAMEAITDSGGSRDIFAVDHDGDGLRLCGSRGHPIAFWSAYRRFVFVRPR